MEEKKAIGKDPKQSQGKNKEMPPGSFETRKKPRIRNSEVKLTESQGGVSDSLKGGAR